MTNISKERVGVYTAERGDSFRTIVGFRTDISISDLEELNPNIDGTALCTGQKIHVPVDYNGQAF